MVGLLRQLHEAGSLPAAELLSGQLCSVCSELYVVHSSGADLQFKVSEAHGR